MHVLVVGAGVFGVTAALALRGRGHDVTVLDPGPLPRPEASSTDTSRAVRMDYGTDAFHTELAAEAIDGWERWEQELGVELLHLDGMAFLVRGAMAPGSFEHDSFEAMVARGLAPERLDAERIAAHFPGVAPGVYTDGYVSPRAGWVHCGDAMRALLREAERVGVELREGEAFGALIERGGRVAGVRTVADARHEADSVLVAAGAWTPVLLPWLAAVMTPVAQPLCYFAVPDERVDDYRAPRFAPFGADIASTGWYGFPACAEGLVKVGNHGPGYAMAPDGPRTAPDDAVVATTAFAREAFPGLLDPSTGEPRLAKATVCFYCDTFDGDFWIDRDPDRPGLVVAAGGSGHGFKFAPVLGAIITDAVEGGDDPRRQRYRWRTPQGARHEQARRS